MQIYLITIPVSIAALEFIAEFYVKLDIFSRAGIFIFWIA